MIRLSRQGSSGSVAVVSSVSSVRRRWAPKVRWSGTTAPGRKMWLRAGSCTIEIVCQHGMREPGYVYSVYDNRGRQRATVTGLATTLKTAQRESVSALLLQHERYRNLFGEHSTWHIGKQSLAKLTRLAALYALEG